MTKQIVKCKNCKREIVTEKTGILMPVEITPEVLSSALKKILLENTQFDRREIVSFANENFNSEKNTLALLKHLTRKEVL